MKKYFAIVLLAFLTVGIVLTAQKANPASDFVYSLNSQSTGIIILKYKGNEKNVIIPSVIEDYPVEEIGEDAFGDFVYKGSDIESIIIPDSVVEIASSAFKNCKNLKAVRIGSGIRAIGMWAFKGCVSLTKFDIGVEKLEEKKDIYGIMQKCRHHYYGYGDGVFKGCTSLSLKEQKTIRDTGYKGSF